MLQSMFVSGLGFSTARVSREISPCGPVALWACDYDVSRLSFSGFQKRGSFDIKNRAAISQQDHAAFQVQNVDPRRCAFTIHFREGDRDVLMGQDTQTYQVEPDWEISLIFYFSFF